MGDLLMKKRIVLLTLAAMLASTPISTCYAAESTTESSTEDFVTLKKDYDELKKQYDELNDKYNKLLDDFEKYKAENETTTTYDITGTVNDVTNDTFTVTTEKGNKYTFSYENPTVKIGETVKFTYKGEIQSFAEKQPGTVSDITVTASAPAGAEYETGITYENLSRNPDDYEGKLVKFTGTVVQLIEDTSSDEIQIRFAVNDNYDTILYCGYDKSIVTSRVLEDDTITIYGRSVGLISYESTMGGTITIPAVYIDKIDR